MTHILLIDNELESVESRVNWLEESGFNVISVSTLTGAWNYIKDCTGEGDNELPLVLLDIMMPTIDDLDWLSDYEKQATKISAPTAGLEFAEKLKKNYPEIKITWHSVRHKTETAVSQKMTALGFGIIQKDLQNRTEFIKEVNEAFKL